MFYQDLYQILWKISKILRTSTFDIAPNPRPQTSTFDNPSPFCGRPLWMAIGPLHFFTRHLEKEMQHVSSIVL